jgi:hypothetical protein
MYENIIPALQANESKPLAIVEPLDRTFCLHKNPPFLNGHAELHGRPRNPIGDTHDEEKKTGRRVRLE